MVTPALDQTAPRLHPLHVNWTSRAWWSTGQAIKWLSAAVLLYVMWVIPQGGLETVSNTTFWWSCAAAIGAVTLGALSRGAQWQAWAEVPGANAVQSLWSRPRFEFTRVPDLLAAALRYVAVAVAGAALAAQSSDHAYVIGAAGAVVAFMAVFHAMQEIATRKINHFPVNWTTVAREGIGIIPGVAWCMAGTSAGVTLGSQMWVLMITMYVAWKVTMHLMRSSPSEGLSSHHDH